MSSSLSSAWKLNPTSVLGIRLVFFGCTLLERSSSPNIQHSAGTIIGRISLYCPVATFTSVFLITLAGILSASPSAKAFVIIAVSEVISANTLDSASNAASLYCVTIAVELSPLVV